MNDKRLIRIATRRSPLALWQANAVKALLEKQGLSSELLLVVTTGDKMQKGPLANLSVGNESTPHHLTTGKGLFVKEIQESLLAGEADIAVHSMKDLPVVQTEGLHVSCVLPRAQAPDVLIPSPALLDEMKKHPLYSQKPLHQESPISWLKEILNSCSIFKNQVIGTTSARRQTLLRTLISSDIRLDVLRGNVDSRLKRVRANEFAAIILAKAGLDRLQLFEEESMFPLETAHFTPAPAQGIVAIENREDDEHLTEVLQKICHAPTLLQAVTERHALHMLGGDCHTAIGAHLSNGKLGLFCAKGHKHIVSSIEPDSDTFSELLALLEKSKHSYTRLSIAVGQSAFSRKLHQHFKEFGYDAVSEFRP